MPGRATIVLLALMVSSVPAAAQNDSGRPYDAQGNTKAPQVQGTQDEEAACSGDAKKFCSDDIPDTFRVLACLQKNRTHISVACRGVLTAHGQ